MSLDALYLSIQDALAREPGNQQAFEDCFEVIRAAGENYLAEAHQRCRALRAQAVRALSQGYAQYEYDLHDLNERMTLFDAPVDFDAFIQYMEWNRPEARQFYAPRRHRLLRIVRAFQEVNDGDIDLLTVSVPKRIGKTTLGVYFVLFRAGQRPLGSSLCCGSVDQLAALFHRSFLTLLQDENGSRFLDIFPPANIVATNADERIITLQEKKAFATITSRSVHGSWAGSTEATPDGILYIDDPVTKEQEVTNREFLDKTWDIMRAEVVGRRLEGCPIVAQGTRYSLYDPIGRLQEHADEMGWRTKVLEIPALDPVTDESNFTIYIGGMPRFSTEFYQGERKLVTEMQWESQYQQQPFEAKGQMFPKGELNYFFELPADRDPDAILAVCDTAEGGGDSVAMPIGYIYGDDVFLPDLVFNSAGPDITKPQCAKALFTHKVGTAVFESNNAGTYYARDVSEETKKLGGRTSIRTKRTISNKKTRIEYASDNIKKHFYFLHESKYERGSQYWYFMREVTQYTRTGKVAHDDAPDSLSLMENEMRLLRIGPQVEVAKRFW